jgi:hypothetical protein
MARYTLDFGSANGGLTPPTFLWFRDAATFAPLPAPQVYADPTGSWTYFFDYTFPVPTSPNTSEIDYGLSLAGVGRTGQLIQPGFQPTRVFLDPGIGNAFTPHGFVWYRDALTKIAIAQPTIFFGYGPPNYQQNGIWTCYFDAVFPVGTQQIEYGVSFLGGVGLSGTINAPVATAGIGGSSTLAQLLNRVRFESDTQGDPNITDDDLTDILNISLYRPYDKLITCYGDDYYSAQAQFTTDGVSNNVPLPDGTLYGGAPPFYKGELLEVTGGPSGATTTYPITLEKFNFREKNQFNSPLRMIAVPNALPRYRNMGNAIIFQWVPSSIPCNLWYAPKLAPLVNMYDVANDFSGWLELAVIDAAIKVKDRQQQDITTLAARLVKMEEDIDRAAANRDMGSPNTVATADHDGYGMGMGLGAGGPGGFW